MRSKIFFFLFVSCCFLQSLAFSLQTASSQLQASNLMNPNISVIGWFQGEAGHRNPPDDSIPAFDLKEAEVAFQAVVDPFSRADVILSITPDGIDAEEGTLTWFHLPANLGVKIGKFKTNFGKFNRTHTAETAFADRPLIHQALFGDEGLAGSGASLSWNIPNPFFFTSLDVESITSPDGSDTQAFAAGNKKDLTYVGRLSGYFDLTECTNVTLGLDSSFGPAGNFIDVNNSSHTMRSKIYGTDVTFRWKNPRQAIYRSALWQTEIFRTQRDLTDTTHETSVGLFSHLEYQFARRWRVGVRWDYAPSPINKHAIDKGGLAYVTFYPSEFSLISIQGRHVNKSNGQNENIGWIKVTFNIGPHGAHPF